MSDYDITQRRIVGNKKIQYTTGGSRVKPSINGDSQVTRVGHLHNHEVHSAASPYILVSEDARILRKQADAGLRPQPPAGFKFRCDVEFDKDGNFLDQYHNKWSPDCEVMPGDVVLITDHEDTKVINERGWVKRVRSEAAGRIAVIMMTGGHEQSKHVVERGQYKVIKRSIFAPISEDDYLARDLTRKDIVKEDLE